MAQDSHARDGDSTTRSADSTNSASGTASIGLPSAGGEVAIERGWAQRRLDLYDRMERAIREEIAQALRNAAEFRNDVERDTESFLRQLRTESKLINDEVAGLRREQTQLTDELTRRRSEATREIEAQRGELESEIRRLRTEAEEETSRLRTSTQEEAQRLRASAETQVTQLRNEAQTEVAQLR